MKKILAIVLALCFVFVFASCKDDKDTSSEAVSSMPQPVENGVYSIIDEARVKSMLKAKVESYFSGGKSDVYTFNAKTGEIQNPGILGAFIAKTYIEEESGIYVVYYNTNGEFQMSYLSFEGGKYYALTYYGVDSTYRSSYLSYFQEYNQDSTIAYYLTADSEITEDALTKEDNHIIILKPAE